MRLKDLESGHSTETEGGTYVRSRWSGDSLKDSDSCREMSRDRSSYNEPDCWKIRQEVLRMDTVVDSSGSSCSQYLLSQYVARAEGHSCRHRTSWGRGERNTSAITGPGTRLELV